MSPPPMMLRIWPRPVKFLLILSCGTVPASAQQLAAFPQPFDVILEKQIPNMVVITRAYQGDMDPQMVEPMALFRKDYQAAALPAIPPEMILHPASGDHLFAVQIPSNAVVPDHLQRQNLKGGLVVSTLRKGPIDELPYAYQDMLDYISAHTMIEDTDRPVRWLFWQDVGTPPDPNNVIIELQIPVTLVHVE